MDALIVVYVIFGIISLVFFFKVWGMTNDIRKIKNKLLNDELTDLYTIDSQSQFDYLRKNLLAGNVDYVKQRLVNNFNNEVVKSFKNFPKGSEKTENLKQSIRPIVEKLAKQLDKIGEQLPGYIKRMETYNDFFNVFTIEDFK